MSELDVLVVGAGISGLSIAHNLARAGLSVEVWEASSRVGGKIQTLEKQGYRMEKAASMVMNFRGEVDSFLRGAGLEQFKRSRAPTAKRYVADKDQLLQVPSRFRDLISTPILSKRGKLRLLAEPLVPRSQYEDESVADFVTRRLGKEFLEKVFEPYVAGPLSSDANLAEAQAAMPKLMQMEKRYRSLALGALMRKVSSRGRAARPDVFSFSGGMQGLTNELVKQGGFRVRNNLQVNELWPTKGGWMTCGLQQGCSRSVFSRQLIITTPSHVAAGLVHDLDSELAQLLQGIEYAPIKVVHTGFNRSHIKHALNGSGFLVPRSSGYEPNGCLWMSSLFPDHAPEGKVLFSSYLGGARNPSAVNWDSEQCQDAVMKMLDGLLAIKADPEMLHIETHNRGLPLYHGAYSKKLMAIGSRVKKFQGLHLEANYNGGVSVRDRILCAQKVAKRILEQPEQKLRSVSVLDSALIHDSVAASGSVS